MLTSDLLKVNIPYLNAYEVFIKRTIPRGYNMAKSIYPHLDDLNANTRGALVSLVLSRGNRLEGEDKAEMREIIDFTRNRDYEGIADALERSKRHFEEKGLDDQVKRREAEADLVLYSLF
jgi:GH24 family phage-related lysozyme (muramidase)